MQYLIYSIVFTGVFFLAWQFLPQESEKTIRKRLKTVEGKERAKTRPAPVHLLAPIASLNKLLPVAPLRKKIKAALASAGSSLTVNELLALKELSTILCPLLYVVFVGLPAAEPMWIIIMTVLGFMLPDLWLKQRTKARQNAIAIALPGVIDLLNLAVGAGLDFMVAVKKMIEKSQSSPLVDELHQVWQETNVGKTRREALRNMARRVNMPEISSFVRTLVQADKMGTGIEEALRMQAEEVLSWRFQRGEKQALKAPIKMLFPLLVFILPVVLIIVGGPIILQFLQGGFGLR